MGADTISQSCIYFFTSLLCSLRKLCNVLLPCFPQAGHPFSLRCARSAYSHARLKQETPVFLLFLDCVWQLGRQFPFSLEFNERLLLTLFEHSYASPYGTFLCNNERER